AVVEAVADIKDTDVEALPPLTRAVKVGALNELLRATAPTDPGEVIVSLQYHGCNVSLSSAGWLEAER
ncbi:hypothetical protein BRD22_06370, partial [Halobacteriales archaeon SW_8_68_21]